VSDTAHYKEYLDVVLKVCRYMADLGDVWKCAWVPDRMCIGGL